jgi:hypothetical protein
MGIERIAMLNYQIGDIRMFYENDVRLAIQSEHLINNIRLFPAIRYNLSCFKVNNKRIFTSIWARKY